VAEDTLDHLQARINKGLIYNLAVSRPSTDGIDAIKRVPGVKNVTTVGGKVVVEIAPGSSNGSDTREQIVETAVNKKMGVLEFSAERVSLEEIFLQLTTVEPGTEKTA
jgi:hypothetical protein